MARHGVAQIAVGGQTMQPGTVSQIASAICSQGFGLQMQSSAGLQIVQ
jgi:hypothetical protein